MLIMDGVIENLHETESVYMKKIITTLMALSLSMVALGADNIDKQLAKDCVSNLFTGWRHQTPDVPETWKDGYGPYSYWPREEVGGGEAYAYEYEYDSLPELCKRYHRATRYIRDYQISGKSEDGCAVQGTVYRMSIKLEGKTRFGEEHNEQFTCYYTGRNYEFHSSWNET